MVAKEVSLIIKTKTTFYYLPGFLLCLKNVSFTEL